MNMNSGWFTPKPDMWDASWRRVIAGLLTGVKPESDVDQP